MLDTIIKSFESHRRTAEKALDQVPDEALNHLPHADGNSLGMQVRHVSGNIISRFTNFLTEDGEKSWRNRDAEFEERAYSRQEVDDMWGRAWDVLDATLEGLEDDDLKRTITIRSEVLTVEEALVRSLTHFAYHVGQIVLLARIARQDAWDWITVPKGESEAYNLRTMGRP